MCTVSETKEAQAFKVGHCHLQLTGVDIWVAYNRDGKIKSA